MYTFERFYYFRPYVGSTGDSTGNHLHLGTRYSNAQFTVGGDFYEGVDFFNPTELIGT